MKTHPDGIPDGDDLDENKQNSCGQEIEISPAHSVMQIHYSYEKEGKNPE